MIANKCGCIVERTNFILQNEGGQRTNGEPIREVKYKKCPACYDYTRKRDQQIIHALVVADNAVPELKTTKASTRQREVAAQKWNRVYHTTMNDFCRGF